MIETLFDIFTLEMYFILQKPSFYPRNVVYIPET